jgi:hypothetical protein
MKAIKSTVFAAILFISTTISAQSSTLFFGSEPDSIQGNKTDSSSGKTFQRRVNFYVVNKPKTVDLFSRLVVVRARKRGMTRRDKFIVIVAKSAKEARDKMEDHLQKKNAMLGSLWFDTHGRYANGYSSFILGKDEFSYKTINDTAKMKNLRALATYCDEYTRVAIGSCYGGATYEKPAHNGNPASRMNGDSLMIGLANLLPNATIYGTEGWVMTKPGIFHKHSYALAGYPLQKRFKDEVYKPVWEHMGIWHSYSTITKKFEVINTLSLTRMGSIHVKEVSYLDKEKSKQRLEKHLAKLKPGLLKG